MFLITLCLATTVACSRPAPSVEAPAAPSGPLPTAPATASPAAAAPSGPAEAQSGLPAPAGPTGPTGAKGPSGATGPAAPTGPAPLPELPVEAVLARLGTIVVPLTDPNSEPVDPAAAFEVRLPLGVRGARLVLLDSQDALVPSSAESEIAAGRSRFTLVPIEPLRTGSRYVLRIEGVESRQVISDDGRPHEPLAVPFLVSGAPPPKAAPPKKGQKKRPL